jgi:hypothetical protein
MSPGQKSPRNGGEGYGPNFGQDIQDREEMARKVSLPDDE